MTHDDLHVPDDAYDRIGSYLASASSPVGIDAKKTHVIILYKLLEIEERLARIERTLQIGDKYNR